ncbi:uncharacterized protein LOC125236126 [Leguminivora glycinivorella]|uniref:uncharacterized protein LOC125236126 n=1 Tax=Leguminivora glycinivorella TaxID=1035111 RepID=UPI002010A3E8|nr:uncharacterized protein LOC125236126 [Leguminivora glycinivorella]
MSDSELSYRSRSLSPQPIKKSSKDNKRRTHSLSREPERVTLPAASSRKANAVEPAGPSKRKKTSSASKKSGTDLFQIIRDEEKIASISSERVTTTSSFSSRVSSGTSRRTVVRPGPVAEWHFSNAKRKRNIVRLSNG